MDTYNKNIKIHVRINSTVNVIRARLFIMWSVLEVTQRVPPTCTTTTSRTARASRTETTFAARGVPAWASIAVAVAAARESPLVGRTMPLPPPPNTPTCVGVLRPVVVLAVLAVLVAVVAPSLLLLLLPRATMVCWAGSADDHHRHHHRCRRRRLVVVVVVVVVQTIALALGTRGGSFVLLPDCPHPAGARKRLNFISQQVYK